ncbi:MAG: hypothetical protein HY556_06620 [Euryarchaeota archaeon]|nr:hypothetical protein [Euryarchaeota archaeon]
MLHLSEKTLRSLKAISAVMAIIANYPTHVNGAYITSDDEIEMTSAASFMSTQGAAEAEA